MGNIIPYYRKVIEVKRKFPKWWASKVQIKLMSMICPHLYIYIYIYIYSIYIYIYTALCVCVDLQQSTSRGCHSVPSSAPVCDVIIPSPNTHTHTHRHTHTHTHTHTHKAEHGNSAHGNTVTYSVRLIRESDSDGGRLDRVSSVCVCVCVCVCVIWDRSVIPHNINTDQSCVWIWSRTTVWGAFLQIVCQSVSLLFSFWQLHLL